MVRVRTEPLTSPQPQFVREEMFAVDTEGRVTDIVSRIRAQAKEMRDHASAACDAIYADRMTAVAMELERHADDLSCAADRGEIR